MSTSHILLACMCQKQKVLSNVTHKPHMQISLCTDMRQLYQYICLMDSLQSTIEHWYTYISHYRHMPLKNMPVTLHMYVLLHCNCSLHIDPKILHPSVKTTNCNIYCACYCHICACNKYDYPMLH